MPRTSIKNNNIDAYSYLRIIACYAIIILHSLFASTVYYGSTMSSGNTVFELCTEHMMMWAVPSFLMVTGALLLQSSRAIDMGKLFKKYIWRMLLALIAFTLLFQILDYIFGDENTIVSGWITKLFTGQSWAHMWYLYLMVGLYLMLPIYKLVTNKISDSLLLYLIVVLLVFTSLLPMLQELHYATAFGIPTQTIYPVYLFIGYYLYRNPMKMPPSLLLLIGCSAVIIGVSLYQTKADSEMATMLACVSKYNSIFVVGQTVGMFGLFTNIPFKADAFVLQLDKCTFGIYLIHMIGIRAVMKWYGLNPYEYGPVFFVLFAVLLFLVSFAITYVLRKIPKLHLL